MSQIGSVYAQALYSLAEEESLGKTILDELKTLREGLRDSNAVAMQNYQMDKRLRVLAEKNRLHDVIHRQTAHQINLLGDWLGKLQKTADEAEKRELLRRIVVVGTYLKRRNNLILVSEQDGIIKEEELKLSIREMMKNLQAFFKGEIRNRIDI